MTESKRRTKKIHKSEQAETVSVLASYQLQDIDREIIRLLVDYPDIKNKDLARVLSTNVHDIASRKGKAIVKKALIELFQTNKDLLVRTQQMALHRLMKLIQSPDESIALRATQIALTPMMNEYKFGVQDAGITEIIFRSRIGSQGQLMQDIEKVEDMPHKTTLDLLAGGK